MHARRQLRSLLTTPAALGAVALLGPTLGADVRLPAAVGDHMVLQCEREARLWGWAEPGEAVALALVDAEGAERAAADAVAGEDGRWTVELPAQAAGGPFRVFVRGANELVLEDVWFGELWIASGQSNMVWPLVASDGGEELIAAAGDEPLRLMTVPQTASEETREDFEGAWQLSSPESARGFSAVAYHFGRDIAAATGRKVGLIQCAWGGTPAEAWTPQAALAAEPDLAPLLERQGGAPQRRATTLYEGMVHPLLPLRVRGVIWYQGEANAGRAYQYRTLFPTLIRAWRAAFETPDLPFLFVQLASFKQAAPDPSDSAWAELREAQALALTLPNTGMAVTLDVGEAYDIHPRRKRAVGERLARWARASVYGEDLVPSGPLYAGMNVFEGKVELRFEHLGGGLVALDRRSLRGFQIAGEDRVWRWASARIFDDLVVVWRDDVPEPVAVRYAWGDDPPGNLGNAEGLPAAPFRTDDWPGVTWPEDG